MTVKFVIIYKCLMDKCFRTLPVFLSLVCAESTEKRGAAEKAFKQKRI